MNTKTMLKCKFSNDVHKLLEPNFNTKIRGRKRTVLTDAEKLAIFNEIMNLHNECSSAISSHLFDKREKKRLHAARVARGYKFKKKTKKEDYLKTNTAA